MQSEISLGRRPMCTSGYPKKTSHVKRTSQMQRSYTSVTLVTEIHLNWGFRVNYCSTVLVQPNRTFKREDHEYGVRKRQWWKLKFFVTGKKV